MKIRRGFFEEVFILQKQIPELRRSECVDDYSAKIGNQEYLILIAEIENKPIGFKLGYFTSDTEFYSWVGGVIPEFRKKGIAKALLDEQEKILVEIGCQQLKVKSMNRYPVMMHLLVSNGYKISGYEDRDCGEETRIIFVKNLISQI